jgi:uncharacterized short protein YbdD (DUF466 family)
VHQALRAVRWWVRGVTGADAYERYVEHRHRLHPGQPVPTRAEFWRERHDAMERDPRSRCC